MTQEEKDALMESVRRQHEQDLFSLLEYLDAHIPVFVFDHLLKSNKT